MASGATEFWSGQGATATPDLQKERFRRFGEPGLGGQHAGDGGLPVAFDAKSRATRGRHATSPGHRRAHTGGFQIPTVSASLAAPLLFIIIPFGTIATISDSRWP